MNVNILWNRVEDNEGRDWFYPENVVNSADYILYEDPTNREGFGNRTLTLTLFSGEKVEIVGPWHSNSPSLYACTGVDLRLKHYTKGWIAPNRDGSEKIVEYCSWVLGDFDMILDKARELSVESRKILFAFTESIGGTSLGPVYP